MFFINKSKILLTIAGKRGLALTADVPLDTFLNISYVLDDLTSVERSFHSLAPFYEKHFSPKTNLRQGTAKSVLVLRNSLA